MAETYGRGLHVNSEDVMWGLGQVSFQYDVLLVSECAFGECVMSK